MTEDFRYHKLEWKHKKRFIIHQIVLFLTIIIIISLAINQTNPVIETASDKMSLTIGGGLAVVLIALAFMNRLKKIFKIKFIAFMVIWVLLFSMQMVMTTLLWGIGALLIPLMIDDLIMSAYWNKVWYNNYDK